MKWPKIDEAATGIVFISFIVEKNGKLSDITIIHGITKSLDKEALRVIRLSPRWIPAKLKGKSFRCRYTVPVRFQIDFKKVS